MKLKPGLAFGVDWLASMAWHLYRIVTLRPAFQYLGDTRLTMWSFISVYSFASLLRWHIMGGAMSVLAVAGYSLVHGLVLTVLFERRQRSSSMTFVALGASAAMDLLVCTACVLGLLPSVSLQDVAHGALQLLEPAITLVAYAQFTRESAQVKSSGYRATDSPPALSA